MPSFKPFYYQLAKTAQVPHLPHPPYVKCQGQSTEYVFHCHSLVQKGVLH